MFRSILKFWTNSFLYANFIVVKYLNCKCTLKVNWKLNKYLKDKFKVSWRQFINKKKKKNKAQTITSLSKWCRKTFCTLVCYFWRWMTNNSTHIENFLSCNEKNKSEKKILNKNTLCLHLFPEKMKKFLFLFQII